MNRQPPGGASESGQTTAGNLPEQTATAATQPRVADLLASGLAHHQVGRLAEAELHYRQVLAAAPGHADALHLLGVLAYQGGRPEMAIELISQATQQNGNNPSYHTSRGLALHSLKRLDEALDCHDRALALVPDNAEALNNRGLVLQELGRFDEALRSYDRALAVRPDFAKALNNRGNTLQALERLDEAVASYDRALALEPNLTEAFYNRGEALRDLEQRQLRGESRNHSQTTQFSMPLVLPHSRVADPRELLDSMYRAEPQLGSDGRLHALNPTIRIPPEEGALLTQLYAMLKPQRTLEVGLGYGFSTVFFMMAMQQAGGGHHTAIDPCQHTLFHGIGATRVALLQMEDRFMLIEKESAAALPLLAAGGLRAQLIFIDGQHRFDNALVDFFLSDVICAPGGIIVFDDMWMPSIQKVVRFIANNRIDYRRMENDVENSAVFRKVGTDGRAWDHYVEF